MLNILDTTFRSLGQFSEEELNKLEKLLTPHNIEAGEALLKPGETCSTIHFISLGAFYLYQRNEELDKVVDALFVEGDCLVDGLSFTSQKPTKYTMEAFVNSTVYSLELNDLHQLIEWSPKFFQLGKVLDPSTNLPNLRNTPQQRYEELLAQYPTIIKIFPLKHIASFLRITPETLSRIRKNISK
ncbi:MAG: Crp/Fnr family transcriptional regulator [Marinoscillum sp.]